MSSATAGVPVLDEVRTFYEKAYPVRESGVFRNADWKRVARAFELIHGPRVLEVGVGAGQLFNALARVPTLESLTGLDIVWNQKFLRPDRGHLELGDIRRLRFDDDSFDCVVCMEVLEHLEVIDFPKAIAELRRVCAGTLIVTIPFEEPEPVWHHNVKGGHRQSFDDEKLDRFFPLAERQLIWRGRDTWPWVMLTESR